MTPDELAAAARNLAYGLGIAIYIRDGRIYQHGPGIEFLPPKDASPTPQGSPSLYQDRFFAKQARQIADR